MSVGSGIYIYPVEGVLTRDWGTNPEYYKKYGQKGHNGLDLGVALKTPVLASRDGVVKFSGDGAKLPYVGSIAGNYVLIDHGDIWTGYAHNFENKVAAGQFVRQGEVIAFAGRTGDASGVHVHFEFIKPSYPVTNQNGYWGRESPYNFNLGKGVRMIETKEEAIQLYIAVQHRQASQVSQKEAEGLIGRTVWSVLDQWLNGATPDGQEWHNANNDLLVGYPSAKREIVNLNEKITNLENNTGEFVKAPELYTKKAK